MGRGVLKNPACASPPLFTTCAGGPGGSVVLHAKAISATPSTHDRLQPTTIIAHLPNLETHTRCVRIVNRLIALYRALGGPAYPARVPRRKRACRITSPGV